MLSSLANPIPNSCAVQSLAYDYATYNTVQYLNDCGLVNDDATSQKGNSQAASVPLGVSISACSYCPGTGPGAAPVACALPLQVGDACNAKNAPCCPPQTECSDQVCVPLLSNTAGR